MTRHDVAPPDRTRGGHLDEDTCLDLVHRVLAPADEAPLLAHVRACSRCELALQRVASERERFRSRARTARRRPVGLTQRAAHGWFAMPRMQRVAFAASAVLVTLAAVWLLRLDRARPGSVVQHLGWLPDVSATLVTRDTTAAPEKSDLGRGLQAYAERDVDGAVRWLSAAGAPGRMETLRQIYLGSALARSERFTEAAGVLQAVALDALPEPWRSESRLTLALVWDASGRAASADSLMTLLAQEPGAVGERAQACLAR